MNIDKSSYYSHHNRDACEKNEKSGKKTKSSLKPERYKEEHGKRDFIMIWKTKPDTKPM